MAYRVLTQFANSRVDCPSLWPVPKRVREAQKWKKTLVNAQQNYSFGFTTVHAKHNVFFHVFAFLQYNHVLFSTCLSEKAVKPLILSILVSENMIKPAVFLSLSNENVVKPLVFHTFRVLDQTRPP